MWYGPSRLLWNAMLLPSGLHEGRTFVAVLLVSCRIGEAPIALAWAVRSMTASAKYRTRRAYMRLITRPRARPRTSASARTRARAGSRTLRSTRLPGEAKAVPGSLPSPRSWQRTRSLRRNRLRRGSPESRAGPKLRPNASCVAAAGDTRRRAAALCRSLPARRRRALLDPGRRDGGHQRPARERVAEVVEQLDDDAHHRGDVERRRDPETEARHRHDVPRRLDQTRDGDEREEDRPAGEFDDLLVERELSCGRPRLAEVDAQQLRVRAAYPRR